MEICEQCLGDSDQINLRQLENNTQCLICKRIFSGYDWINKKLSYKEIRTFLCINCANERNCCQCCMKDIISNSYDKIFIL